jgi:hypothetical protein
MSEILGHDVNGRPLRAGDRVVILASGPKPHAIGGEATVLGPNKFPLLDAHRPEVSIDGPDGVGDIWCDDIRRLDDRTDHQPSEYTFDSLMDHLKSGVPA